VAASQAHVDGKLVQQTLPIHLIKSIGVEALLAVLRFVMDRGVRIGALAPSATLVDDWGCNTNTPKLDRDHAWISSHLLVSCLTDLGA
jgi:hypothetical protein